MAGTWNDAGEHTHCGLLCSISTERTDYPASPLTRRSGVLRHCLTALDPASSLVRVACRDHRGRRVSRQGGTPAEEGAG
jgi:hypothetical protein